MTETDTDLMIREQLARIDQLNTDATLKRQEFELGYPKLWALWCVGLLTAYFAMLLVLVRLMVGGVGG